ncbi:MULTISPECIES: hypothetical protein [Enterobacter]|uniref:hypothetical protein n=1 Tax=Enterobacter TaxID=547 RepID=UPI0013D7FDBD|nr:MULTISPECIES: hypothetical protein [Enterobacter]NEV81349.1 hypothetical protein [Enterobacter asburiae]NMD64933.1 hypothetical protein [Enterobacter sp. DNRA5]HCU2525427.1 hypothetical protein [Enterobacter hormaechei]HDX4009638.1 hypothetical protein [Enterobacter asburiae]
MKNDALTFVLKKDWMALPPDHTYNGKYMIGEFHLTDIFIIEFMKLMHRIEIPDAWVHSSFTDISDINTRKVMYMKGSDILSQDIMNEIRKLVKSPSPDVKIYCSGNHLTKIELMQE